MLRDFLAAARAARSRAAVFAVGYRQRWASHPSVGAAQLVFDRLLKVLKDGSGRRPGAPAARLHALLEHSGARACNRPTPCSQSAPQILLTISETGIREMLTIFDPVLAIIAACSQSSAPAHAIYN